MEPQGTNLEAWIGMYAEVGYQQLDRYLEGHAAFEQYLDHHSAPQPEQDPNTDDVI